MKNLLTASLSLFVFSGTFAQLRMVSQPQAISFYNKAMVTARPQIQILVNTTAHQLTGHTISADSLRIAIKNKPQAAGLNGKDIDALLMFVLMQVNNDAEKDLRDQMNEMKQINNQKNALRNEQNKMNAQQDSLKNKLAAEYAAEKKSGKIASTVSFTDYQKQRRINIVPSIMSNSKDALSDISGQQQLKMQMVMDRMSKAKTMISNIMKSISDTQNSIIDNFK